MRKMTCSFIGRGNQYMSLITHKDDIGMATIYLFAGYKLITIPGKLDFFLKKTLFIFQSTNAIAYK